jgi:hypothetical protein
VAYLPDWSRIGRAERCPKSAPKYGAPLWFVKSDNCYEFTRVLTAKIEKHSPSGGWRTLQWSCEAIAPHDRTHVCQSRRRG